MNTKHEFYPEYAGILSALTAERSSKYYCIICFLKAHKYATFLAITTTGSIGILYYNIRPYVCICKNLKAILVTDVFLSERMLVKGTLYIVKLIGKNET